MNPALLSAAVIAACLLGPAYGANHGPGEPRGIGYGPGRDFPPGTALPLDPATPPGFWQEGMYPAAPSHRPLPAWVEQRLRDLPPPTFNPAARPLPEWVRHHLSARSLPEPIPGPWPTPGFAEWVEPGWLQPPIPAAAWGPGTAEPWFPAAGWVPWWNLPAPGYGWPAPIPAESTPSATAAAGPAEPVTAPDPDADRDGIALPMDLCPDSSADAVVDAFGCASDARIVLRGVNFRTDSAELTESSLAILDSVSTTLAGHPEIRIEVAGHTDSDGDDAYNKDLSQRRAQTVVNYLLGRGVKGRNMTAVGYGEEQPLAPNDSAEGRAENRRVELNRL